jgi:hypothetical protein
MPSADPAAAPSFTTSTTNVTFFLNTSLATFAEAEEACQVAGGHLASYSSLEEQAEVEQHYVHKGWFLKPCHQ